MEEARSLLAVWESFYVIVGSSGAALTGLQFVVIALSAESTTRDTGRAVAAFTTPTVVHFCTVLLVAAIISGREPRSKLVLTMTALLVWAWNFVFLIHPQSRVEANEPLRFALLARPSQLL